MTKLILLATLSPFLLLAACAEDSAGEGGGETEAEASESASADSTGESVIAVSETAWLSVGSDGAVQTTYFDSNARYRDFRNGAILAEGRWQNRAPGFVCFVPDRGIGDCWNIGPMEENRTAIATNGEGKSIEIKQVTYIAPPVDESEEAAES